MNENYKITDETNKEIKGYAFDSLVYRFRLEQEKAYAYELSLYSPCNRYTHKNDYAKSLRQRKERDLMAFIRILDDVIGEHN